MSFLINEEVIGQVNESTDMVDLVSDYLELKQSGSNYLGLCPFHDEKTPSFSVSPSKEFYHCFGCGAGGDAIDFIMKIENLDFIDAVKFLADRNGIEVGERTDEDRKRSEERDRVYRMNRDAARFFYKNLLGNRRALNYLKKRKLGKKIINTFGLGYALDSWDSLLNHLREKGYREKEIFEAGLAGQRRDKTGYYDRFRDRIIFPIINTRGKVIGFGGRVLGEDMPKYLNSQDTKVFTKGDNLYGLNIVGKSNSRDRIVLVEGYMDVISLYNSGISYSVASLGTALTKEQAKLLKRYGRNIYICYDGDLAGRKATLKAMELLKSLDIDAGVIVLPEGDDPDDYIKKRGIDDFKNLLDREAMNFLDYNIYMYKKKYNISNPDEKIKFTQEISSMIRRLDSPIEREVYIDKISLDTGISKDSISLEVEKGTPEVFRRNYEEFKSTKRAKTKKREVVKLEPAYRQAEKTLIRLSFENREYYKLIEDGLKGSSLISEEFDQIFKLIGFLYTDSKELESIDIGIIKDELAREDDLEILEEIGMIDLRLLPKKQEDTKNLIDLVNRKKIEMRRDRLLKEIKLAQDRQDMEEMADLTLKLIELNDMLKNSK